MNLQPDDITARCERVKEVMLDAVDDDESARAAEAVCGLIDVFKQMALDLRRLAAAVPLE